MAQQKSCQDCNQSHDCKEVYRQVGKVQGSSVVFKVVAAFLLPLVVFIAALAVFEKILAKAIAIRNPQLQTALSFLLALSVTFVCMLIIKKISTQLRKDK